MNPAPINTALNKTALTKEELRIRLLVNLGTKILQIPARLGRQHMSKIIDVSRRNRKVRDLLRRQRPTREHQ